MSSAARRGRGRGRASSKPPSSTARSTSAKQETPKNPFAAFAPPSAPNPNTQSTKPSPASNTPSKFASPNVSSYNRQPRHGGTYSRGNKTTTPRRMSPAPASSTTMTGPSSSPQQRYQLLKKNREKERADAIAQGFLADPDKPRRLADAIKPVGTCQDMCAEFERVERIVQKDVWAAELESNTSNPAEHRMVKKFRRAAAGVDEQLPSDLRPPVILQKTLNYLVGDLIDNSESLAKVHHFVWDRTRAIRNDFSIQQLSRVPDLRIAIECYERIARFHILSLHHFAIKENAYESYDWYQEREQLDKTLLSLLQYYDDSRSKMTSPNEPEFRAYSIIFQIKSSKPDIESRMQSWPQYLMQHPKVRMALKLYNSACNTVDLQGPLRPPAYHKPALMSPQAFFKIVGSNQFSFLMSCVAELYFNQIRRLALTCIWNAYRTGASRSVTDWSISNLKDMLGFSSEEKTESFVERYGFAIKERPDGEMYIDLTSISGKRLPDPAKVEEPAHSYDLVEYKRYGRRFCAVINGLSFAEARNANLVDEDVAKPEKRSKDSLFVSGDTSSESSDSETRRNQGNRDENPNPFAHAMMPKQSLDFGQPTNELAKANPFAGFSSSQSNSASPGFVNPFASKQENTETPKDFPTAFSQPEVAQPSNSLFAAASSAPSTSSIFSTSEANASKDKTPSPMFLFTSSAATPQTSASSSSNQATTAPLFSFAGSSGSTQPASSAISFGTTTSAPTFSFSTPSTLGSGFSTFPGQPSLFAKPQESSGTAQSLPASSSTITGTSTTTAPPTLFTPPAFPSSSAVDAPNQGASNSLPPTSQASGFGNSIFSKPPTQEPKSLFDCIETEPSNHEADVEGSTESQPSLTTQKQTPVFTTPSSTLLSTNQNLGQSIAKSPPAPQSPTSVTAKEESPSPSSSTPKPVLSKVNPNTTRHVSFAPKVSSPLARPPLDGSPDKGSRHPLESGAKAVSSNAPQFPNSRLPLDQDPFVTQPDFNPLEDRNRHRARVLDLLAKQLVVEEHNGFIQQYLEYEIGNVVIECQALFLDEKEREKADKFRISTLFKRYGLRWRQLFWKRRGLRRAERFRESLRQSKVDAAAKARGKAKERTDDASDFLSQSQRSRSSIFDGRRSTSSMGPPPRPKVKQTSEMVKAILHPTQGSKRKLTEGSATDSSSKHRRAASETTNAILRDSTSDRLRLHQVAAPRSNSTPFEPQKSTDTFAGLASARELIADRQREKRKRVRGNTMTTEYFRLKAMGVNPSAYNMLTGKRPRSSSSGDEISPSPKRTAYSLSPSRPHSSRSNESDPITRWHKASDSLRRLSGGSPVPMPSIETNPVAGSSRSTYASSDPDEDLFRQARELRQLMAESTTMFQDEMTREGSRLSGSFNASVSEGSVNSHEDDSIARPFKLPPTNLQSDPNSRNTFRTVSSNQNSASPASTTASSRPKYWERESRFVPRERYGLGGKKTKAVESSEQSLVNLQNTRSHADSSGTLKESPLQSQVKSLEGDKSSFFSTQPQFSALEVQSNPFSSIQTSQMVGLASLATTASQQHEAQLRSSQAADSSQVDSSQFSNPFAKFGSMQPDSQLPSYAPFSLDTNSGIPGGSELDQSKQDDQPVADVHSVSVTGLPRSSPNGVHNTGNKGQASSQNHSFKTAPESFTSYRSSNFQTARNLNPFAALANASFESTEDDDDNTDEIVQEPTAPSSKPSTIPPNFSSNRELGSQMIDQLEDGGDTEVDDEVGSEIEVGSDLEDEGEGESQDFDSDLEVDEIEEDDDESEEDGEDGSAADDGLQEMEYVEDEDDQDEVAEDDEDEDLGEFDAGDREVASQPQPDVPGWLRGGTSADDAIEL